MNRYYVTIPEGRIKYYAPSEQEVKRVFPEATNIDLIQDTIHEHFINIIHNRAIREFGKGRWVIDTVFGKMEYQQFYDPDEPHKPLDGCKYRLVESIGYTFPILWSLSNPEDFYDTFMKTSIPETTGWARFDYVDWAKIKKDGHFRRTKVQSNQGWFWANNKGEIYEVDKQRKKAKDLWKKFKDNPDTIRAEIESHFGKSKFIYFTNNAEYEEWSRHNEDEVVISTEKTLPPNPDLAKNVFKVPWYPIKQSPFTVHQTAVLWRDVIREDAHLRDFSKWKESYELDVLERLIQEVRNDI